MSAPQGTFSSYCGHFNHLRSSSTAHRHEIFKVREKSLPKSRILSTYNFVKAKQTPSALAGWVTESSRVSYQMDLEVSLFCQLTRKRSFAFFLQ